jgi:hypothetical protein
MDAALSDLYRRTSLARALGDALSQLVEETNLPHDVLVDTLEAFDNVSLAPVDTLGAQVVKA